MSANMCGFTGLKSKPDKWKGTALGPPADDLAPVKIEPGLLGEKVPAI